VIAIIAILAAILFPVFARAREKARQTNCLSNIKQLDMGIQMYTQDYDEMMPFANYGTYTWRSAILPYVKNAQIFQCPSKKMATPLFSATAEGNGGYAMNIAHDAVGSPTPPYGQPLGAVEDSASCILVLESDGGEAVGVVDNARGWVPTEAWATRHNGGANYGFVDGHAKFQRPDVIDSATGDSLLSIEIE